MAREKSSTSFKWIRNPDRLSVTYQKPFLMTQPDQCSPGHSTQAVAGRPGFDASLVIYCLPLPVSFCSCTVRLGCCGKTHCYRLFINPGTRCNFEQVESTLLRILDETSFEVHVECLPGEVVESVPRQYAAPRRLDDVTQEPCHGGSVSTEARRKEAGSLGGWLNL
ncbi:hypothetical protein VTO42DRAFT_7209 [Malbranchea cinnamomea]